VKSNNESPLGKRSWKTRSRKSSIHSTDSIAPKEPFNCNVPPQIDNSSSDDELNKKMKEGVQIVFPLPAFE
jgi:hypothetical protein